MRQYTFTARLILLLGLDVLVTILDSYVPHELWPVRGLIAGIQLLLMAATMVYTMRRVLEDY